MKALNDKTISIGRYSYGTEKGSSTKGLGTLPETTSPLLDQKTLILGHMKKVQLVKLSPDGLSAQTSASQMAINIIPETVSISIVRNPSLLYHVLKRSLDIFVAVAGILLLLPVFLAIAVSIKLDDGGEVLHFREIIGKHGRRFFALKFRTMIPNADEYLVKHPELMQQYWQNMKLDNDPRITRFGQFLRKTSLDELPQLFNVLVGQMSLVGPRIIHPSELSRYGQWAQKRLSVRPGITGLWQISGRQHNSYNERVLLDLRYLDNRSTVNDLIILIKTFKVFIIHTGA
jgi:lipopolysaccharide/colanic/teichoic acid biosynthesis glycosyltransferase